MPQNKMLITDNEGQGLLFPDKAAALRRKLKELEERYSESEVLLKMFVTAHDVFSKALDMKSDKLDSAVLDELLIEMFSHFINDKEALKYYELHSNTVLF